MLCSLVQCHISENNNLTIHLYENLKANVSNQYGITNKMQPCNRVYYSKIY